MLVEEYEYEQRDLVKALVVERSLALLLDLPSML